MTRAPIAGETKTRLNPSIGAEKAALLAQAFFEDCLDHVYQTPDLSPLVLVSGDPHHPCFSNVRAPILEQVGDCLGARIEHALSLGLAAHDAALVIGSDSPTLPTAYLLEAARLLQGAKDRAVIGPAADGGFYLLGLRSLRPGLLADIGWSEASTCGQTLRALEAREYHPLRLPPWYDVDDARTLSLLRAHLRRRPNAAKQTAAVLFSKEIAGL